MHFGGLQKNSFIDFPGRICAVVFAAGCNFDCPYCHNPELVFGNGSRVAESDILAYLTARRGWLDGVVISGGEPTLQNDLPEFCKTVKTLGYPVKLDTNGSRPEILTRLLDGGLVDYIAMDIKTDPRRYAPRIARSLNPQCILDSIDIIMGAGIPYEFKTTCVKSIIDMDAMDTITRLIRGADLYAIQRFVEKDVLHPEFFAEADRCFSDEEFLQLKAMADRRVKTCILR